MNILELYIKKNKNKRWFDDHAGSGTGSHGKMFDLFNTNFRDFKAIFSSFKKIKKLIKVMRSE